MSEEAPKTEPAAEQPAEDTPKETEAQPEQPSGEQEQQEEATPKTEETTEEQAKPEGEGEGDKAPAEGEGATAPEEPQQQEQEPEEEEDEEPEDDVPIVLVTGASGYVAMHIVKQLLEQGRFRVRGTVRDKKREDKVKPLKELVPDAKYPLRLVTADLEKPDSWVKAVKRCSYVFHVASPFFIKPPKREDDMIRPAVEGTNNVLKACVEAGTVKRVVLTSSIAAISSGQGGNPGNAPDHVYTEKDWSDEASCPPYEKSKLKAEQAAWAFVKELDEDKRFELVVVNPAYVQGPFLSKAAGKASTELCAPALNGSSPADVSFSIVDVRDVAAAHIAGMEKLQAAGNRYILVGETVHVVEIHKTISAEFKAQGYKVSVKPLPKVGLFVGKFFNARAKQAYALLGKTLKWSNELMKGDLGIEPRPINETIIDMCYSLVDIGLVKKTRGYLGHPSTRPEPKEQPAPETTAEETPKEQAEGDKPEDAPTTEQAKEEDKPATEEPTTEQAKEEDKPAPTEEPTTEEPTTETKPEEPAQPKEQQPATEQAPEEGRATAAEGDQ